MKPTPSLPLSLGIIAAVASTALGAYDLKITEIWPGQTGNDVSEDWFEIYNAGDSAWTAATDGKLHYLDDRTFDDLTDLAEVQAISSIAPGEIVIVVRGDAATVVDEFKAAWMTVLPSSTQVGYADGKGLSDDAMDGIQLFVGDSPTLASTPVDTALYDPAMVPVVEAASYLPNSMSYSVSGADGAGPSDTLGGDAMDTAAIASPGIFPVMGGVPVDECTGSFIFNLQCWWTRIFQPSFTGIMNFLPF